MKSTILLFMIVLTTAGVPALLSANTNELPACDCPDCREKAAKGGGFSLPGLQGLDDGGSLLPVVEGSATEDDGHDHEGHDHAAHDSAEPYPDGHGHQETDSCCDEGESGAVHMHDDDEDHDHAGHGHAADAMTLDEGVGQQVGIKERKAAGGTVARTAVFPAEIKLNGDRTASVSPRYASVIRQVFAEIGDEVKKGDVLASLENRETMAVYTVSAPLDGVIIAKDLAVGETADASRVLYEVADLETVWADISIFPKYQHMLRKGMGVTFIAHDGHTADGSVKYISPIVSHETRTFTARCILKGADEDFTPGAFVRAELVIEKIEAAVAVPRAAVQRLDGESVVFVKDEHGYEPVPVETGLADRRMVEIRSGLEAGDMYVAEGAFVLKAQVLTSGMDPHAGHGH